MNITRTINLLNEYNFGENAKLVRNGFVWESNSNRYEIVTQKQENNKETCLWVNIDKLNGDDKDIRCDYNNTKQVKTIKELRTRLELETKYK